ncbi:hypothetical protein LY76DRAFT_411274 [Colletotrichum caudatum]|nr:hypothetical protein LY76DRAFT_411274 [Colletotrichum caudatum]
MTFAACADVAVTVAAREDPRLSACLPSFLPSFLLPPTLLLSSLGTFLLRPLRSASSFLFLFLLFLFLLLSQGPNSSSSFLANSDVCLAVGRTKRTPCYLCGYLTRSFQLYAVVGRPSCPSRRRRWPRGRSLPRRRTLHLVLRHIPLLEQLYLCSCWAVFRRDSTESRSSTQVRVGGEGAASVTATPTDFCPFCCSSLGIVVPVAEMLCLLSSLGNGTIDAPIAKSPVSLPRRISTSPRVAARYLQWLQAPAFSQSQT